MSELRPIGYFVHHQGRGHAERALAIARAVARRRPVMLFAANEAIFGPLPGNVALTVLPSLFEPSGDECGLFDWAETPDTLHCAPLGWPGIRQAIATLTGWFASADPALFVTDVSAELGQLARIASVPHVAVLQHGRRDDPGHIASYRSAIALLAPYHPRWEQDDRPGWMRAKTLYAPGVGIDCTAYPTRADARKQLNIAPEDAVVVAVGGGGGEGLPSASLSLGARAEPGARWFTLGHVDTPWHQTQPANLVHLGWRTDGALWLAAADRIVSTCGNTTVHEVARLGVPWVAIPQWRYFDEQRCKAAILAREKLAAVSEHWPSRVQDWAALWTKAAGYVPTDSLDLIDPMAAQSAALALEALIDRCWSVASDAERLPVGSGRSCA